MQHVRGRVVHELRKQYQMKQVHQMQIATQTHEFKNDPSVKHH